MSITIPTSPAPLDIPIMPGSAKGLPMTPCKMAPDIARFTPTIAAVIMRGRRMFFMTMCAVEPSLLKIAFTIVTKSIFMLPIRLPITKAAQASTK